MLTFDRVQNEPLLIYGSIATFRQLNLPIIYLNPGHWLLNTDSD